LDGMVLYQLVPDVFDCRERGGRLRTAHSVEPKLYARGTCRRPLA
jgi:hypothetical protein